MDEMKTIRAVEMVRQIRDDLVREWADKSPAELVAILNRAGAAAREEAFRSHRDPTTNPRMEPTRR